MAKKKRTTRAKVDNKRLHKRTVRRPKAKSRGKAKPKPRRATKKRAAKKAPAKKRVAKKRVAKKRVAKKRVAKKAPAKKRAAKKAPAKKRVAKKAPAKKRIAKKAPAKKRAAKKAPAKKRAAKKAPAKKRIAKKAPAKKRVSKNAPAKRTGKRVARAHGTSSASRREPPVRRTPPARPTRVAKSSVPPPPARGMRTAVAPRVAPAPQPAAPAPLIGVRVGRLPPRTEAKTAPQPRPGFVSPHLGRLGVSPTLRRAEVTQETWKRVDGLARDLGLPGLRSQQRRAIRSALEGNDTLVALASGLGKSACYQIPAQLLPQPVVVVSPRAALGREHHDRLLHRRVPAVRIDAAVQNGQRKSALARIAQGGPLVVLTTPDALAMSELSEALARTGISLLVVDDAHTFSEWSDELCAASTLLGSLIARLGSPPLMALLGAAPPAVRHDVVDALGLRSPTVVDDLAIRDNIVLDAVEARGEVRQRALVQLVMRLRRPGIIYASTPREVDAIHAALGTARVPVHRYHPELPAGERVGEQLNFMLPGRRTVMVATSAFAPHVGLVGLGDAQQLDRAPEGFGLGLDKRDVRFVIHWGAPASLEQYAREIGAAGRDGDLAHAVLLFEPGDSSKNAAILARNRINAQHLALFVRALEARALEASSTAVESLALESGLTRATADTLASALDAAGLVSYRSGWLTVQVPSLLLSEQARRLGAQLGTLRAQDDKRLEAVNRYVEGSECKRVALGRYFGAAGLVRCGQCSACGEPSLITTSGAGDVPRRREPARDFSVTRVDRYERFEHGYSSDRRAAQSLTAKLGDFSDVPVARVR